MQASDDEFSCGRLSLLTPIGGDCGYCKGEGTSRTPNSRASYYARSKSLCPRHYQKLMDRGWRRSGSLLYLPDASRSCCPHYTIRLSASQLNPIRDQRQAVHRWNRFVLGERYIKEGEAKYPKSKQQKKQQNNTFNLQASIHESESPNLKPDLASLAAHTFTVTLEPDTYTEEKYQLFSLYQRAVHHETDAEISRKGFRRFLCDSPLHLHTSPPGQKLGSYHQLYRLDDQLIALAVLDLLPHGVSSVYFIYHPDFTPYSLGKLSALREAALAVEGGYEWLYMGYYIHACEKMRYKADYRTQQVLDLDSFGWDPLDEGMRALMGRRRWVGMSREREIGKRLAIGFDGDEREGNGSAVLQTRISGDSEEEAEEMEAEALYAVSFPTPAEAMNSQLSAATLKVPGVTSLTTLLETLDLDRMKVTFNRGVPAAHQGAENSEDVYEFQQLRTWNQGKVEDTGTLKGIVAELAACVGAEVAGEVVVDLGFD